MKDLEKRKRVMGRSMRLGHCICDPKKPCPCDLFRQRDVCLCAGERLDGHVGPVRLMSLVSSAGCASKIDKSTLDRVLKGLPFFDDPRVLVGAPAGDDAGVYRLDDESALVQTVDVFAPSNDDPYVFGQIAAANSLSDIYAMGGRPITALSIVGFPVDSLPEEAMRQILRGGVEKMAEAGVAVVGGHSINDKDLKAGFAVTGLVHPRKIMTNAAARPGDCLVLTKPLGTGIISFAAQIGRAPAGAADAAARSMAALNARASAVMIDCGAHACTDVTGFGLAGHLGGMAAASGVDVEIAWDDLPLLPGVLECLAEGIASGAVERNRQWSGGQLIAGDGVEPAMLDLFFDPQTSGGLLIATAEHKAADLLARLHADGSLEAAIIGRVCGPGEGRVLVRAEGRRPIPPATVRPKAQSIQTTREEADAMSCCEGGHPLDDTLDDNLPKSTGGAAAARQAFSGFLQAAGAPGLLDARTKQSIAIALSVLARCEPCLKSHIKKAREMGFSQDEIDEAAWMAISFGGSPTMMFYNALRRS